MFIGDCRTAWTRAADRAFSAFLRPVFPLVFYFINELLIRDDNFVAVKIFQWNRILHGAESVAAVNQPVKSETAHVGACSAVILSLFVKRVIGVHVELVVVDLEDVDFFF